MIERGRVTNPFVAMLPAWATLELLDEMLAQMARTEVAQQLQLALGPDAYGDAQIIGDRELFCDADGAPSAFGEFVAALDVVSVLALLLRRGDRPIGNVLLSRMTGQSAFETVDQERLLRLHPVIESGFVLAYGQLAFSQRARGLFAGRLTQREIEIVELVAAGAPNREVADRLGLSLATVKTHLYHAYQKLGVTSRSELAAMYRREA